MKKIIVLLLTVFLVTGCSITIIDNSSIDKIVDNVLKDKITLNNVTLQGYKYYLPKGITLKNKTENNSILYYKQNKIYLYIDLVSYYHKVDNEYKINEDGYYSRSININEKKGYLEINRIDDKYFIEFMYNYAKIEAYVEEQYLNETILDMAYILSSIKYNDIIIESLVGDNKLNYTEENYNIFESRRTDGNFLDYLEEYGQYEDTLGEIPDEDSIDISESTE